MPLVDWFLAVRLVARPIVGCALLMAAVEINGSVMAASPSSPRVAGFERFHRAADADAIAGGLLLASELSCHSCHAGTPRLPEVTPRQAPVLTAVGQRVRPEWIQAFLAEPHTVKPGTTMPDVLSSLPDNDRREAIEALSHFLAGTGHLVEVHADQAAAKRGEGLYRRAGCVACHEPDPTSPATLATSVALPRMSDKYSVPALVEFLKDPGHARPSGRMPALGLKDEDYRDIAQYLLKDLKSSPNTHFASYRGDWEKLPDFAGLKPLAQGECAGFDLTAGPRPNNFAMRFTSLMEVPVAGDYHFTLGSDDGSRLMIDGEEVVNVDGIHPHQEARKTRKLDAGWHDVVVEYFQGGGEWTLEVQVEGPQLPRQPLDGFLSLSRDVSPLTQGRSRFQLNPQLAERGQQLFSSLGCANCHTLRMGDQALAGTLKAPAWKELQGTRGCLAGTDTSSRVRYGLDAGQQAALRGVLQAAAPSADPAAVVDSTFVAMNCYACHVRGEKGGVEEGRNAFFTSSQQEMGDEGRIPPSLTGVGDKLQDDWLKRVLNDGANDRQNYMHTRMPKFRGRNVGHLTALFIGLDRQPDSAPQPVFEEPLYRVKADGRHLVGAKALSCIKCHDFGPHPAQGIRAINMATMTRRLRQDWFHRYVANPQDFRPGTRMPAAWPFGQSTVRDVLGGNADKQIRAVWDYLSDGEKAAIPLGLVREPIELVALTTPVIYRNFIEGAGSRAIGVGYPERLNLAWDANNMRLAMIWHGAFIDASRHWNGRGVGFEPPLGDHIVPLPDGPPLAQLASPNDPWPTTMARDSGFRFRGYTLDDAQRPTFRYTMGDAVVTDALLPKVVPELKDPHLVRTLTFSGSGTPGEWLMRVAVGKTIAPGRTAGSWRIDNAWTLTSSTPATVRESAGQQELVVPVTFGAAPFVVKLEYAW